MKYDKASAGIVRRVLLLILLAAATLTLLTACTHEPPVPQHVEKPQPEVLLSIPYGDGEDEVRPQIQTFQITTVDYPMNRLTASFCFHDSELFVLDSPGTSVVPRIKVFGEDGGCIKTYTVDNGGLNTCMCYGLAVDETYIYSFWASGKAEGITQSYSCWLVKIDRATGKVNKFTTPLSAPPFTSERCLFTNCVYMMYCRDGLLVITDTTGDTNYLFDPITDRFARTNEYGYTFSTEASGDRLVKHVKDLETGAECTYTIGYTRNGKADPDALSPDQRDSYVIGFDEEGNLYTVNGTDSIRHPHVVRKLSPLGKILEESAPIDLKDALFDPVTDYFMPVTLREGRIMLLVPAKTQLELMAIPLGEYDADRPSLPAPQAPKGSAEHSAEGLSVVETVYTSSVRLFLMSDSSLWALGDDELFLADEPKTVGVPYYITDNVKSVSGDRSFRSIHILKKDGSLWAMGVNGQGQLGTGKMDSESRPVHIMDGVREVLRDNQRTFALMEDGTLFCWGKNSKGDMLGNGMQAYYPAPTEAIGGIKLASLPVYDTYSALPYDAIPEYYAITADGGLIRWGGEENRSPERILENVREVFPMYRIQYALTNSGELYTWGGTGEIPNGTGTDERSETPAKVLEHVSSFIFAQTDCCFYALLEDGSLMGWGTNDGYALGTGDTEPRNTPVMIAENIKEVKTNGAMTLALTAGGELLSWGTDTSGGLGTGSINRTTPKKIMEDVAYFDMAPVVEMLALTVMDGMPVPVYGAFCSACCAITKDGSLYVWGENGANQLGFGNREQIEKPAKLADNVKSYVPLQHWYLLENGDFYAWSAMDDWIDCADDKDIDLTFDGSMARYPEPTIIPTDEQAGYVTPQLITGGVDRVADSGGILIMKDGSAMRFGWNWNNGRLRPITPVHIIGGKNR